MKSLCGMSDPRSKYRRRTRLWQQSGFGTMRTTRSQGCGNDVARREEKSREQVFTAACRCARAVASTALFCQQCRPSGGEQERLKHEDQRVGDRRWVESLVHRFPGSGPFASVPRCAVRTLVTACRKKHERAPTIFAPAVVLSAAAFADFTELALVMAKSLGIVAEIPIRKWSIKSHIVPDERMLLLRRYIRSGFRLVCIVVNIFEPD